MSRKATASQAVRFSSSWRSDYSVAMAATGCPPRRYSRDDDGNAGEHRDQQPPEPAGVAGWLDDHVHDHGYQHDELAARDQQDATDARLSCGRCRAFTLDRLRDAPALGTEEACTHCERQREGDQPEDDPVLSPGPVEVDHHRDPGEQQDPRRRHEEPHADDLGVLREVRLTPRVSRTRDAKGKRLDHHRPADPDRGRDDVNGFEERVPGHVDRRS